MPRFRIVSALFCSVLLGTISLAGFAEAQQVTGGTKVTIDNSTWLLSFSAVQHVDGTVTGRAQHWRKNDNVFAFASHLDIDCMHFLEEDNAVILSGTTVKDSSDDYVGTTFAFGVRDNGEGRNAPADEVSRVEYGLDVGLELDCDLVAEFIELGIVDLEATLNPIQHGSVHYDAIDFLPASGATLATITVPEPTAAVLALVGLPMIGSLRRRRYRLQWRRA